MFVTNSLDGNLFLQIIIVFLGIFAFILILEGFGFVLLRILSPILRRMDRATPPSNGLVLRTLLGGLFYTLIFLALGEARLLAKPFVLSFSLAVPFLAFLFGKRWAELRPKRVRTILMDDKYVILGSAAFLALTFIFWFRPITGFDGMWYHLTVPKLFLQDHDVRNLGGLIRYSLQPSMDYFWNLWPLSLPVSTAVASIIINGIQALVVCMSLGYATKIGNKVWGWSKSYQFFVPILLGFGYETAALFGTGGDDLLGLAYGLVATLYCFYILTKPKISWGQLAYGLLLVVSLATIKAFTTIYACLVLVYLLAGAWNKLIDVRDTKKRLIKLSGLLVIIFAITYLPWIIRAYIATGRPLDPLGTPGLINSLYADSGGGTPVNHWTNYVFTRIYSSFWPMLIFVYSPMVLAGLFALTHKKIRARATELWLLSFVGFWLVFIASIALEWRYYLPQATLLAFLGIATIIEINKDLDLFGKLLTWTVLVVLVATTGLRVVYTTIATTSATVTDATIQKTIYVRHFTGVDDYLNKMILPPYDYVQEQSPAGLTPSEKIFVPYTFSKVPLLYQKERNTRLTDIHNLAYINNPILEVQMDPRIFENITNANQLVALLKSNHIRYILGRRSMSQFCEYIGVKTPPACDSPTIFKPVFYDKIWQVTWYKIVGD